MCHFLTFPSAYSIDLLLAINSFPQQVLSINLCFLLSVCVSRLCSNHTHPHEKHAKGTLGLFLLTLPPNASAWTSQIVMYLKYGCAYNLPLADQTRFQGNDVVFLPLYLFFFLVVVIRASAAAAQSCSLSLLCCVRCYAMLEVINK